MKRSGRHLPRRIATVSMALAVVVALVLHGAGVLGTVTGRVAVGDPEGFAPPAERALIVSIPRLTWEDVEAAVDITCAGSTEPVCIWAEGLADVGATNSLRAIGPFTSLPEGYVTFGSGNRATVPEESSRRASQGVDGSYVWDDIDLVVADADSKLYGAVPGALGQALTEAGLTTAVIAGGDDAVLALMDTDGRVDGGVLGVDTDADAAEIAITHLDSHEVVLVEMSGLDRVVTHDVDSLERRTAVLEGLRAAYRSIVSAPQGTVSMVLTPAPPRDKGQLGVFALQGATTAPGDATEQEPTVSRGPGSVFQSPTTRRVGYVTLTDMAPTLLARLGIDRPNSMNGTPVVATGQTATVTEMADIDRLSRYRDSLVGPISVVYVVLQLLAALVAMWAIRRSSRLAPTAISMACTVLLVPPLAFLSGAFPYDRLPEAVYVVGLFVLSAVVAVGLVAIGRRRGWPTWAAALVLVGVTLAVQWGDIATGGRLQINTPFGYSPIIAGRFQGFGNLSFSMASTAALIVASTGLLLWPRWDRFTAAVWAATIGGVMVVLDGMPAFGADVGGVLALIPTFIVLVTILSGRRMSLLRLVTAGAAGVVALIAFAAFDLSRPESERTHLGRFVTRMLDGEAGLIIERKINANIGILTSSVWTWLVPVIIVFFVVIARRTDGVISRLRVETPGVSAFLPAALVLAVVGFAVNDSGVAIPAAMAGLVLPWITALALALPRDLAGDTGVSQGAPPVPSVPTDEVDA
jgi:hypothetical protein